MNDEWEELNLDAQQRRHAESQTKHFDETVQQRISETFIWMLTPRQELGSAEVAWEQTRVTGGEPIPVRVSKKLAGEEGLLTQYAGTRLRMDLDRVPLWPADAGHVSTQQLWSYYAQYLYLPRLRNRSVLVTAIESGVASLSWEQDTFAYADAWDEDGGAVPRARRGSGAWFASMVRAWSSSPRRPGTAGGGEAG